VTKKDTAVSQAQGGENRIAKKPLERLSRGREWKHPFKTFKGRKAAADKGEEKIADGRTKKEA